MPTNREPGVSRLLKLAESTERRTEKLPPRHQDTKKCKWGPGNLDSFSWCPSVLVVRIGSAIEFFSRLLRNLRSPYESHCVSIASWLIGIRKCSVTGWWLIYRPRRSRRRSGNYLQLRETRQIWQYLRGMTRRVISIAKSRPIFLPPRPRSHESLLQSRVQDPRKMASACSQGISAAGQSCFRRTKNNPCLRTQGRTRGLLQPARKSNTVKLDV